VDYGGTHTGTDESAPSAGTDPDANPGTDESGTPTGTSSGTHTGFVGSFCTPPKH
jgi:hypothetical protein